jgi:hypothetical protein
MNVPRETIAAALWTQLQQANTGNTPFNTMSRRWIPWSSTSAYNCPALFLMEQPGTAAGGERGLTKWVMRFGVWVYLNINTDDYQTVVSTALNNYFDAIDAALAPQPPGQNQRQTLGGLVQSCFIDGTPVIDEGLLAPPSLLFIPVTVITGQ